jgi:hypothetical protein
MHKLIAIPFCFGIADSSLAQSREQVITQSSQPTQSTRGLPASKVEKIDGKV